jgi:hypothetical protein
VILTTYYVLPKPFSKICWLSVFGGFSFISSPFSIMPYCSFRRFTIASFHITTVPRFIRFLAKPNTETSFPTSLLVKHSLGTRSCMHAWQATRRDATTFILRMYYILKIVHTPHGNFEVKCVKHPIERRRELARELYKRPYFIYT